jgi:hypothetical protein
MAVNKKKKSGGGQTGAAKAVPMQNNVRPTGAAKAAAKKTKKGGRQAGAAVFAATSRANGGGSQTCMYERDGFHCNTNDHGVCTKYPTPCNAALEVWFSVLLVVCGGVPIWCGCVLIDVVPYFLSSSFSNKPDAIKALMALLAQPAILRAILEGQIFVGAGDRFMYLVAQGFSRDPPAHVAKALRMCDQVTFACMEQQFREFHTLQPGVDVGEALCEQLQRAVIVYNGLLEMFQTNNILTPHRVLQTCCTSP